MTRPTCRSLGGALCLCRSAQGDSAAPGLPAHAPSQSEPSAGGWIFLDSPPASKDLTAFTLTGGHGFQKLARAAHTFATRLYFSVLRNEERHNVSLAARTGTPLYKDVDRRARRRGRGRVVTTSPRARPRPVRLGLFNETANENDKNLS